MTPRRRAVDLSLSPEDLAFRDEGRRFLADNVRPGMGRAIDLTPAFIVDPDVLIDFHRATPQGLVGAALASRAWRHGWSRCNAISSISNVAAPARPPTMRPARIS